jgi:undecaprenyl diphosphate synthase
MDPAEIPRHIAIVMDGNGRWTEQRRSNFLLGRTGQQIGLGPC